MLIPRKRDWIQKRLSAKPAETEIVGHYPQNPFLLGANGGLSAHEMNGIGANTKIEMVSIAQTRKFVAELLPLTSVFYDYRTRSIQPRWS
jgi:hypothetical protein